MEDTGEGCSLPGCRGLALPGCERCLPHADETELERYHELVLQDQRTLVDGQLWRLNVGGALASWLSGLLQQRPGTSIHFSDSSFESDVDFTGLQFGTARFTNCKFSGDALFNDSEFTGDAIFQDCVFDGQALFWGCQFEDDGFFKSSRFTGRAVFQNSLFNGDGLFIGDRFDGDANFNACKFKAASFNGNQFAGFTQILGAEFGGAAYFEQCRFGGPAHFGRSEFARDAHFGRMQLDGHDLSFDHAVCHDTLYLDRVKLTAPTKVVVPRGTRVSLEESTLSQPLTVVTHPQEQRASFDDAPTQLVSLQNVTLEAPLLLGDTGLDYLRITTVDPGWPVRRRRRIIADELPLLDGSGPDESDTHHPKQDAPHPKQVEAIYRQLRAALEASKAAPAAADFYYGEMEMRRRSCARPSFDRTLLALYKCTSGYGLRASRALLTYLLVLLGTTLLLRRETDWFVASPTAAAGSSGLSFTSTWDVFAIAARSSVSVLSANTNGLTAAGTILFIVLRLVGPATIALTILAVRAKVQR
jgi:uncharacterized protein YjbI with pentapeptide repeats